MKFQNVQNIYQGSISKKKKRNNIFLSFSNDQDIFLGNQRKSRDILQQIQSSEKQVRKSRKKYDFEAISQRLS